MIEYTPTGRIKKPQKTTCKCGKPRRKHGNMCLDCQRECNRRNSCPPLYAILGNTKARFNE